jgi:hypothetical protein
MNMTSRPLVQDLVKQAMASANNRTKIASEGSRQMKLASAETQESPEDTSAGSVSTDYALKLAAAIEFATPAVVDMSKKAAPNAPPAHITETQQTGPEGVSHSHVSGTPPGPGQQGKGRHQPPTNPGTQKAMSQEHGATQLENTIDHHVAGEQTTAMSGGKGKTAAKAPGIIDQGKKMLGDVAKGWKAEGAGKALAKKAPTAATVGATARKYAPHAAVGAAGLGVGVAAGRASKDDGEKGASADLEQKNLEFLSKVAGVNPAKLSIVDEMHAYIKQAEDAINPASISAGPAVPPDTNAAGEPGGAPVGGMPQGPSSLVGSNESAINYKKQTAYSPRKAELARYFSEPALSAATDKTLHEAFAHTGEAGVKISSQQLVKSAAARSLLAKLAEEGKEKCEKCGKEKCSCGGR